MPQEVFEFTEGGLDIVLLKLTSGTIITMTKGDGMLIFSKSPHEMATTLRLAANFLDGTVNPQKLS